MHSPATSALLNKYCIAGIQAETLLEDGIGQGCVPGYLHCTIQIECFQVQHLSPEPETSGSWSQQSMDVTLAMRHGRACI